MKQRNEDNEDRAEIEELAVGLRERLVEIIESLDVKGHSASLCPEDYYLSQPLVFPRTMVGFTFQVAETKVWPEGPTSLEPKHACLHLTYMPEVDAWTVGLVGGHGTLRTDERSAVTYAAMIVAHAAIARSLTPLLEDTADTETEL